MTSDKIDQEEFSDELPQQTGCELCGSSIIEENYNMELCKDCRKNLYQRPFPAFIKIMSLIIAIIFIIALTKFPSSLKDGIQFEKGKKAENGKRYLTAMNTYKELENKYSDSTLILSRLFITAYNNDELDYAFALLDRLAGRDVDDESLLNEVNGIIDRIDTIYYISDELETIFIESESISIEETVELYRSFLVENPEDIMASYYFSNLLFELDEFDEGLAIIKNTVERNPDFFSGQLLLAAFYRELGEFDKARECCNEVLRQNTEYSYAYAALSRIELKDYNDSIGLDMALKAYELNEDSSNVYALALAYHYNNMMEERDNMYNKYLQYEDSDPYTLDLMESIFSQSIEWR